VLAALNITHELLGLKQEQAASSDHLARHLQALKSKLEAGLPSSLQ
jgi:cell division protein ZapA (FtsZ GTPase activity inhibitor)